MAQIEKTLYRVANVNDQKVLELFQWHLIKQFTEQKMFKLADARTSRLKGVKARATAKAESYGYVIECLKAIEFTTND